MLRPKQRVAQTQTVTAPVGGWNALNSLANMPLSDAVIIDNWFCLPTELMLRKGYTSWATGITGSVESFITYNHPDGTIKNFAAVNNAGACSLYDVTAKGAVGSAALTGLTSAKFKCAQMATTGGNFTMAVNGTDTAKLYEKTAGWTTPTITGPSSTALFNDVQVHGRRLWFVEKNSLKGWYLPIDSIAGAAVAFDFGPIFKHGGHLVRFETWTLDAGDGMDDYLVAITSAGEVAVYTGYDPADASTWALKGVYYCGAPVGGNQCTIRYGGDVLLLNKDGLVPLSQWIMSSRVNIKTSISNKIQQRITDATSNYDYLSGWQIVLNPPENMLFINVPISGTESHQYVMNTITGAWSRFTDINAKAWVFIDEELYFSNNGTIYKFWDGHNDDGALIVSDLLPAFTSFGSTVQIKRLTMTRIMMGYDNEFNYSNRINLNFDQVTQPNYPISQLQADASKWDSAKWDSAKWGGSIAPFTRWQLAAGMGHYVSMRLKTSSLQTDIRFYAIDYIFEMGGIL